MDFIYKEWDFFCKTLTQNNILSITARDVLKGNYREKYLVLKHDVETNVKRAYEIACIEKKYGHMSSYYIQGYLLLDDKNIAYLNEIKNMGHEVSYHHDVMDGAKGIIEEAVTLFDENLKLFQKNGFEIETVCQHGNPLIERVGYTSNRDFMRNHKMQQRYPEITDIMVDFMDKANTEYDYYSDAGRCFSLIYDPLYNDVINSDDKNIKFDDLMTLLESILQDEKNKIISIHPHRWTKFRIEQVIKGIIFKGAKFSAKILIRYPVFKKIVNKYYYIAKKL